ncbi:MAG: hypothetical protein MI754_10985, partial [Chromatiales bacterium]|nr:hypothetical protein [Chromatiales bacterium]
MIITAIVHTRCVQQSSADIDSINRLAPNQEINNGNQLLFLEYPMKKYLGLILLLTVFSVGAAQQAVTDEGKIVILNSDGTWEYQNP